MVTTPNTWHARDAWVSLAGRRVVLGRGGRSCTMGAGEHGQGPARLHDPFFFTQMIAEIKCVEDQEAVALKEHTAVRLLTLNCSSS